MCTALGGFRVSGSTLLRMCQIFKLTSVANTVSAATRCPTTSAHTRCSIIYSHVFVFVAHNNNENEAPTTF